MIFIFEKIIIEIKEKIKKFILFLEKKIISNLFCCGAYAFRSSHEFMDNAKDLLKFSKNIEFLH